MPDLKELVPTTSRDCRGHFHKYGDIETGSVPIFTCRRARDEIPNDFWEFSRMLVSTEVVSIMSRDCRGHFPNMAASKPEVYVFSLVGEIEK